MKYQKQLFFAFIQFQVGAKVGDRNYFQLSVVMVRMMLAVTVHLAKFEKTIISYHIIS